MTKVTEYYEGKEACTYEISASGILQQQRRQVQVQPRFRHLSKAFIPEGFPHSVSADYLHFQLWDSIQALCSYIRGMLSSQAMLAGVGVGTSAATPLTAAYSFFLRDFSGMLGGVIFAFFQGSGLDTHAKQWRLFADCFNNVGYALELASPVFPSFFLWLACMGSIARAITGVAAGATRAALTHHFAKAGNAADVSAKEGTQETATTVVGMAIGMLVTQLAAESAVMVWSVFLSLTALHIYANVQAMRSLQLTSLNRPRVDIILMEYLRTQRVPSVQQVAAMESLVAPPVRHCLSWLTGARCKTVRLGISISQLGVVGQSAMLKASIRSAYFCWQSGATTDPLVVLGEGVSSQKILQAYAHAWLLDVHIQGKSRQAAEAMAESWVLQNWEAFLLAVQGAGFSLDRIALGDKSWRVSRTWGVEKRSD